jgi:hypothetical protein
MANELELVGQKPKSLLKTDNATELAVAVQKLALAKNIAITPGMLKAWEECLLEDESDEVFYFSDFIAGIKATVRKPIYNRLDYADVYIESKEISYKRRLKESVVCPICGKIIMRTGRDYEEVKPIIVEDLFHGTYLGCSCEYSGESDLRQKILSTKKYRVIADQWFQKREEGK